MPDTPDPATGVEVMETENTQPQDGAPAHRKPLRGRIHAESSEPTYDSSLDQPTVSDVVKLTEMEIGVIVDEWFPDLRTGGPAEALADAATEKTSVYYETKLWEEHERGQNEVSDLQEKLEALHRKGSDISLGWHFDLEKVEQERDAAITDSRGYQAARDEVVAQRDDAREQLRALVEVFKRVLPEPYHCHECNSYFIAVDEDECCVTCGAQSQTMPFEAAIAAAKEQTDW